MKRKRVHECHLCNHKFKQNYTLNRHMSNKHDINVKWHQCHLCDYKAKHNSTLKQHLENKHDIGIRWHPCDHCDSKFKQNGQLKRHLAIMHDVGVKWHQCDHCHYKSKQKVTLKQHMSNKHNIGVIWHQCGYCTYKCKKKWSLKQHMADKHNIGTIWHQCVHCTYKCKQKNSMKSHHAHIHDIGDKFCDICYESVGVVRSIKGAKVCRTCCDDYGFRKERIELKYIKALDKRFPYHMEHDTRVQGDMCLRYRPDAMWLDPHLKCHIQFELDEHQHLWKNGSYDCDEKRISDIYDEFKTNVPEHFVVVRLNPDSELGRTAVFKDRLNHLVEVLEHVKTSPPKEKISIIYMYYDKTNHRIAKNLPKYLLDKNHKSI